MHSFYTSRLTSGENLAVDAHVRSLERAGMDVGLFAVRTDEVEREPLYRVRSGLRVAAGRGRSPLRAVRGFGPDVVHVHNLFPNYGRAWVRKLDVPVVATLHNYRPMCANGLLLRDGRTCTLCPDGRRWSGTRYACYRDSRLASLPLSWAGRRGPGHDPLIARADRLIAISAAQGDIYVRAGVPSDRVTVVPLSLPDDLDPGPGPAERRGWVFAGRLRDEKGIAELVAHWPDGPELTVLGDGPLLEPLRAATGSRAIRFLGQVGRREALEHMARSVGIVVPSTWPEPGPTVYAEAMATATPVLALAGTAIGSVVERDRTGGAIGSWSALARTLDAWAADDALRARCRAVFERNHSETASVRLLRTLYTDVIRERAAR